MSFIMPFWLASQLALTIGFVSVSPREQSSPTISNKKYWGVMHAGDQQAVSRIANEPDFARAMVAARNLGYETIEDGTFTFFVPVPAWSGDNAKAVLALLDSARKRGFGEAIPPSALSQYQRDHFEGFLRKYAGEVIRGDLGGMVRNSALGPVSVSCQVDLRVIGAMGERTISLDAKELGSWLGVSPSSRQGQEGQPKSPIYPKRKELLGLGTQSFCLALSQSTSGEKFLTILNRAKDLFAKRRSDNEKALDERVRQVVRELLNVDSADELIGQEPKSLSALPVGVRIGLTSLFGREPEMFGFGRSSGIESSLSNCRFTIPANGIHVVMSFMLSSTGRASDGSAVNYAVAWDVQEVFARGR